ncbi:MAG: DUF432 domain-containing protein [Planctomycetota bacterium]|nr:DUF432 domain-containing protein [Planctomycetota bacterium]
MPRPEDFFEPARIETGIWFATHYGPLSFWIRLLDDEWQYAAVLRLEGDSRPCEKLVTDSRPPTGINIHRKLTSSGSTQLLFRPAMPRLPIIVRPQDNIEIAAGTKATFFVTVPTRLQVFAGEENDLFVDETTFELSRTWYGSLQEGLMGYMLNTRARRNHDGISKHPHRCIVPVQIANAEDRSVKFERICIEVDFLSIYRSSSHLWSDPLTIKLKESGSEVSYGKKPPAFERIEQRIARPKRNKESSILRWGIGRLRIMKGHASE